ncbi:hypothetical protein [Lysinibacillus sp. NPDC059133]
MDVAEKLQPKIIIAENV